jgi:hypothetical protein
MLANLIDFIRMLREYLIQIPLQQKGPLFFLLVFNLLLFQSHFIGHISYHHNHFSFSIYRRIVLFQDDSSAAVRIVEVYFEHGRTFFERLEHLRQSQDTLPQLGHANAFASLFFLGHILCDTDFFGGFQLVHAPIVHNKVLAPLEILTVFGLSVEL